MLQLEGVSFSSWVNDRLPEMLWASLVITVIPRDQALEAFRDIAALGLRYRKDERECAAASSIAVSMLSIEQTFTCQARVLAPRAVA